MIWKNAVMGVTCLCFAHSLFCSVRTVTKVYKKVSPQRANVFGCYTLGNTRAMKNDWHANKSVKEVAHIFNRNVSTDYRLQVTRTVKTIVLGNDGHIHLWKLYTFSSETARVTDHGKSRTTIFCFASPKSFAVDPVQNLNSNGGPYLFY